MMNVLKHPSFFRPMSRPTSPAPVAAPQTSIPPPRSDPNISLERAARPLNKLSLSNFRRPSPAPSAASTPTPTPLVQDGSYLEMLSLKLSEAVSRALAQPTGPAAANEQVSGRRPIPQGRGRALGALIASEFKATQDSPHLQRAILRALHRPLSVLLSNLSAHLLPLISSSAFKLPPSPTIQAPNPNPTQLHALAIAAFSGELLETFDLLDLGVDSDVRGDGLKQIREGLVSLINRVVGPLVAGIRVELMPLLEALETPNTITIPKVAPGTRPGGVQHHPSIVTLQTVMPLYARSLARYTTSTVSQTILATFLISVIWRGLVALAHRPYLPPSPPPSPGFPPLAIKKSRSSSTPPLTPPAGRFAIKLPPSRPPSPPPAIVPATTAADARALYDLFKLLPCPPMDKEATRLAREVVDDALEGLKALPPLLDAVHVLKSTPVDKSVDDLAEELELLATEVPLLIALPILLHAHVHGGSTTSSVATMLGLSEEEYRKECLFGFGRAEECATLVALRVMDVLRASPEVNPVVCKWLDMEITEALAQ